MALQFDVNGNVVELPAGVVLNNLMNSPVITGKLPMTFDVLIAVPTVKNGLLQIYRAPRGLFRPEMAAALSTDLTGAELLTMVIGGTPYRVTVDQLIQRAVDAVTAARASLVADNDARDSALAQQQQQLAATQSTLQTQQGTLASQQAVLQGQQSSLQSQLSQIQALQTAQGAQLTQIQALQTAMAAKKVMTKIGEATVSFNANTVLAAGVQKPRVTVSGIAAGETVEVYQKAAFPGGFGLSKAFAVAKDTVEVSIINPALSLGSPAYTLSIEVHALR